MAEKNTGMRSSLSADDVGRPSKKPGKLSANFLAQFESDPALSGSSSSLQFPRASPGHGSSSDIPSTSVSQEHLEPARRPNVRISEPLHSSNEEMATGIEPDAEFEGKNEKKRKSLWKWGPLKKVRRFFSRKKGSRKAKSCEDLPASSTGFRSLGSQERLAVNDPRYQTSSTPVQHKADVHGKSSPVMRSKSMPPQSNETKRRQASSHEDIREERSQQPVSKTFSLPALTNSGISSLRDVYTVEAAVSFESDPNASSIEGLQAAHDKIRAAPKKRRPPTRARSRTSSLEVADTPVTQDPKAHKRSKTDPKDLTRERKESGSRLDSSSFSDIINNTIFEDEEGQGASSPQASKREKDHEDAVLNDVMSRVNSILAQTSGPSRLPEGGSPSTTLRASEVDLKKTTDKKEVTRRSFPEKKTDEESELEKRSKEMSGKRELTVAEKRRSFPEKTTMEKELKKEEPAVAEKRRSFPEKTTMEKELKKEEPAVAEKRRSFPEKTTMEKELKKEEPAVAEKRRSFPEKKIEEIEKPDFNKTAKEIFEEKKATVQEKRKSYTDQKSQESVKEKEKSFDSVPKKESVSGFAETIRSSRAETEIVMAENNCLLESEVTFEDFEFDKILDEEPSTKESKKESEVSPPPKIEGYTKKLISPKKKSEVSSKKAVDIKPAAPFKRGKSWSATHLKPKLQEFPFKQDSAEPVAEKKEAQANVLTKKRQEQKTQREENKSDKSEESVHYRFSRTKSWPYGTKPGDVLEANAKENQAPVVEKDNEPSWIASAKQKSRRISQLLQEDETPEDQTPTLVKPNKDSINKPTDSKPQTSPKPSAPRSPPKPVLVINKEPSKPPVRPSKPPVRPSKPPVASGEQLKPFIPGKHSRPLAIVRDPKQKDTNNMQGRSSATLPARTTNNNTETAAADKKNTRQSLNLSSKETAANKKPFGGVKIEKCIVCGTTVYQMEKCKFDDSVLHRNCIKCTVCKRHLTVGNFVMAESKIYCKPHSLTVTVST